MLYLLHKYGCEMVIEGFLISLCYFHLFEPMHLQNINSILNLQLNLSNIRKDQS